MSAGGDAPGHEAADAAVGPYEPQAPDPGEDGGSRRRRLRAYGATLWAVVRLIWSASPGLLLANLALAVGLGLVPVVVLVATSALLGVLADPPPPEAGLTGTLLLLLGALALGNVVMTVSQRVAGALHQMQTTRVVNHVQLVIARRAAAVPFHRFEDRVFHNRMQTAMRESAYQPMMLLDKLMLGTSGVITLGSLGGILLVWSPVVMLALVASSLVGLKLSTAIASRRVRMIVGRAEIERQRYYLTGMLTDERAAKEIRAFDLGGHFVERLRAVMGRLYEQDRSLARREVLLWATAGTVVAVVQPVLLGYTALQVVQGAIGIGRFNLYSQAIIQADRQLAEMASLSAGVHEAHLFAQQLLAFLRDTEGHAPDPRAGGPPAPGPAVAPARPAGNGRPAGGEGAGRDGATAGGAIGLEVDDLWFTYPGTGRAVLKGLSLAVEPGEVVALVGRNGAGKSTLVKLLLGLYEPDRGRVLAGGTDLRDLDADERRRLFSAILQDYTVYHLSARDNIWLGDVTRPPADPGVERAAGAAGLAPVLAALPEGYRTVLGKFWDQGHELSGGQGQLVALARSLYRDAPVLVLDEPSAALDPEAERRFFDQAVGGAARARHRTTLLISHRSATVRRAERIVVIEDGRVVEQGRHDELMPLGGTYARLYEEERA